MSALHCFREDHELYREVLRARHAAHQKHGENSIEAVPGDDVGRWLPILLEEGGEIGDELDLRFGVLLLARLGRVGRSQTYDQDRSRVRGELIQLMAVASAWVDAIDRAALTAVAEPAPAEA